jgi:hypothetical protein
VFVSPGTTTGQRSQCISRPGQHLTRSLARLSRTIYEIAACVHSRQSSERYSFCLATLHKLAIALVLRSRSLITLLSSPPSPMLTSLTAAQPNIPRRGMLIAVAVALYAVIGYQVRRNHSPTSQHLSPLFFHPHSFCSSHWHVRRAHHPHDKTTQPRSTASRVACLPCARSPFAVTLTAVVVFTLHRRTSLLMHVFSLHRCGPRRRC